MISTTTCYVIVDGKDDILLGTLASNRRDAWQTLLKAYGLFGFTLNQLKRRGYKCVRVEVQTEEYKR